MLEAWRSLAATAFARLLGCGWRQAAVAGAALLAACSTPRETFDFSATAAAPRLGHGALVAVAEPSAPAEIDSNRFLVRGENGDLNYLSDAQWADTLPRLVQARLRDMIDAHGARAVRPGDVASFHLDTELRRFEIDASRQIAAVEIVARLSKGGGGAPFAEGVFSGEEPAPHTLGPDAARAYEGAMNQATERLALWVRKRI